MKSNVLILFFFLLIWLTRTVHYLLWMGWCARKEWNSSLSTKLLWWHLIFRSMTATSFEFYSLFLLKVFIRFLFPIGKQVLQCLRPSIQHCHVGQRKNFQATFKQSAYLLIGSLISMHLTKNFSYWIGFTMGSWKLKHWSELN